MRELNTAQLKNPIQMDKTQENKETLQTRHSGNELQHSFWGTLKPD